MDSQPDETGVLPRLQVVDDDPAVLATVAAMLEGSYRVEVGAIEADLWRDMGEQDAPDAILLDIALPEVSGYDLCRAIRENSLLDYVPVIFMSGVVDLERHLAGNDAGGTDFIAKPFRVAELKQKLATARHHAERQRALKRDVTTAFSTAMTAMTSAAEMGTVLQFVQRSYADDSYESLAASLARSCAEFGLKACVQIRGCDGTAAWGLNGEATPLELSILNQIAACGRIVDFKARSAFNYPRATLMVLDIPVADPDRYGRFRDNLVVLAEAADARVQALDSASRARRQARLLTDVVNQTRKTLVDIDRMHRAGRARAVGILHQMVEQVENSFVHLGLTERQEATLAENLRFAMHETIDLFDTGLAIEHHLHAVTETLSSATRGERNAAHPG